MKIPKFKCLTFLECLLLLLFLISCSGFDDVKSSGTVNFSFDARSILEDNNLPSAELQEIKVGIALIGDCDTEPQTLTFTESEINSTDKLQKSVEFEDIPEGTSVYACGIFYAILKEEAASFVYPLYYGNSEPITIEAGANKLSLKLTTLLSNAADYAWEAHGVTSDKNQEFMLLFFKNGRYILEIGSAVPSFGTYQAKSYDENGLPTEFLLTETVYQLADSNDYAIVQKPEAKTISVSDGKFTFTSASGLEIVFDGIEINSENPEEPDDPDKPNTPDSPDNPENPDNPNNPENPDTPESPDTNFPYEIQFWLKKDGATGTAKSDYTCLTDYNMGGNFNLPEGEQAIDIIEALAGTKIQQKFVALSALGYIQDEDNEKDVNNKTDGSVVICYYLKPTYASSGSISIKTSAKRYTLAKNEAASEKFYLNKGRFAFSLLDENGNDVLADVDWDATDATGIYVNQNLFSKIEDFSFTYKTHSVNNLEYYGFNYFDLGSTNPLTKAGTYLLTITVSPNVSRTTYVNKAGQTVAFPDFEPVSGTFEVEVEDVAYYSFSVNSTENGYINFNYWTATDNAARAEVESVTSDVYLHLYGEYQGQLVSVFTNMQDWMNSKFSNKTYSFSIDASEVTSTEDAGLNSYALHNLIMIKSIIMPDCVTDYSTAIFQQCTNLEYVKIGSAVNSLAVDYNSDTASVNLFQGCSNLKQVEFAKTDAWYNSTALISNNDTLDWTSLTAIDVSNPEVNAANILNGTWKYLYRKTE